MANFSDAAEVERSYERNLGYARFWLGAGIAVLSLLFTFGYNLIFSNDDDPPPPSAPPAPEPPPAAELMLETPALFALLALFVFAATCLILGHHFRRLYRQDNARLAQIEHNHQEAAQ